MRSLGVGLLLMDAAQKGRHRGRKDGGFFIEAHKFVFTSAPSRARRIVQAQLPDDRRGARMAADHDVAAYVVSLCVELQKLAETADMQVLALILAMAALEASRGKAASAVQQRQPEVPIAS